MKMRVPNFDAWNFKNFLFLINSTVQDFHGKLWECFGKLGIFGQVRMVYDQKGKPRGCGKGWLMLSTGLPGLIPRRISRGYFWKMVRQEVVEEADHFSLKQVT